MIRKSTRLIAWPFGLLLVAVGLVLSGCSTTGGAGSINNAKSEQPGAKKAVNPATGGAQLWAQTCGHCHNIRSPSSYSDAQWDVVMLHMRVRATLTAGEHKAILAFLKSAH